MITARAFEGQRYGVFGLARTGRSVAAALAASGAEVVAWDDNPAARAEVGGLTLANLATLDLAQLKAVVVSPGVPLNRHPLTARARAANTPVIGDIELFARALPELPAARVVGITGTNGKSTTAALIHHILKTAGIPARLGGNIGAPILSEDPLPTGGAYVLELSSFQIDLTFSLSCQVAVLLNLSPDHLDRYGDMEAYAASKTRLLAMQSPSATAVIATDDDHTRAMAAQATARVIEVSATRALERGVSVVGALALVDGEPFDRQPNWPALAGPHNAQNAAAAIATCLALGLAPDAIRAGLASYPGLPHRMELVRELRGVRFVNDSKATNPTSAAPALGAYPAVHWIAGGQAKTHELDACRPYLAHVRAAYLVGEAAPLFARILEGSTPTIQAGTVARAAQLAAAAARPGEVVLLAPACASYDQFKNYEERGNSFRAAVEALQ